MAHARRIRVVISTGLAKSIMNLHAEGARSRDFGISAHQCVNRLTVDLPNVTADRVRLAAGAHEPVLNAVDALSRTDGVLG